jgi:spore coat protein U-like protein
MPMLAASSAALGATCGVTTQPVSFGNYDTLGGNALDGVGNVRVSCDSETSVTIAIGAGTGSVEARRMTSGAAQLDYNLYRDPTRLMIWGDGIGSVTTTGTTLDLPVYGKIPASQNVPAGLYADSVTVTITY